jgi:hypothetical protein
MAKITIAGDAVVITSSLKLEEIKNIQKYRPDALVLKGGEDGKEPIYAIGVTDGTGSINNVGASFGREATDGSGLASITMVLSGIPAEDTKDWVADRLGSAIMNLNALEDKLPPVLHAIAADRATIMQNITVAG